MVQKSLHIEEGAPLDQIFRPGGILTEKLPNYEVREGQASMARRVAECLDTRSNLVVEAGTGTGKTFAYLLPAVLSGLRVIISTGTLNLQEQIFHKDIPFLKKKLGLSFRSAMMKGRTNYLCKRRWKKFITQPAFDFAWEENYLEKIGKWAETTRKGDRAELRGLPENYPLWNKISCPSHSCLGTKCPDFEDCFVTKMRRNASGADVIVVNHALFFSDLSLRGKGPGVEIIPSYDAVVFDEAHEAPEVATNHFGVTVSSSMISELVRDAAYAAPKSPDKNNLERRLTGIEQMARRLFSSTGGTTQNERFSREQAEKVQAGAADLAVSLEALASQFHSVEEDTAPEASRIGERAREIAENIRFLVEQPAPEYVYYRTRSDSWSALKASPIEIGPILKENLYPEAQSVIYTSATLSVAGGFGYFMGEVGLETDTPAISTGTSFDHARQAILYIPRDLPQPGTPRFIPAAAERMRSLVELVGARTFLLFTSHRAMEQAWELLRYEVPGKPLKQGEAPRSELIEEFCSAPSVLFATMSFWQGVDIPGSALSMVVIDKLPFAAPTDPLVEAKMELIKSGGRDPFLTYQVPQAVLMLRQGLGRLIRHRRDKGVLAMLDGRFYTRSYGAIFRESLSDHRITDDWNQLQSFVAKEGI